VPSSSRVAQHWPTDLSANRRLFSSARTRSRSAGLSAFVGAGRGPAGLGVAGRRAR
jgi:hypothetical protein